MNFEHYISLLREPDTDLQKFKEAKKMQRAIKEVITKEVKRNAYEEHVLRFNGEKGMGLSSVTTYNYEYDQDDMIDKYTSKLKPLEKQVKALKDSIKKREKELKNEGKFKTTVKSQYLR